MAEVPGNVSSEKIKFSEPLPAPAQPVEVHDGSDSVGGPLLSSSQDDERMQLSRDNIRLTTQVKLLMASSEDVLREKVELQTRLRSVEAQNSAINASLQSLVEARQVAVNDLAAFKSTYTSVVQRLEDTEKKLLKQDNEITIQQTRTKTLQKKVELLRGELSIQKVDEEEKAGVIQALKAKISSQQMDIERLQQEKERQALTKKMMDKKQTAVDELEREQLLQELTKVKKDYQQAQEDVRRMVDQSMTQKLQHDALRRENSKLSREIIDLQHAAVKDKTGFLKQLERVEAEQRQREAELLRSEKSLATKKEGNGVRVINENEWSRLAQLLSRSDGLEAELTATKTEAQDIRQRLLMVEDDRKDLLRRVVVAEKSVEERDATIEFLNRRLDSANQRLNDTKVQLNQMESISRQYSVVTVNLDAVTAEKENLVHERAALETTLTSLRKQLNESQQGISVFRKEMQEVKSVNKSLSENVLSLQQEKTAKETEANNVRAEYHTLMGKYSEVTQQLALTEVGLEELRRLKESLQTTEVELTAWKEAAAAWQSYSEHLSVKPESVTSETQSDPVEDERLVQLQSGMSELERNCSNLQAAYQQATEALANAEGRIRELEETGRTLEEQCATYNTACQRLQGEVEIAREETDRYAGSLQSEQQHSRQLVLQLQNVSGYKEERDALQERCDALASQTSQLTEEVARVAGEKEHLSKQLTEEIQRATQRLSEHAEEHRTIVATFEATIEEMNQAVAQHDEQWKAYLQSQTATIAAEKSTLQEHVSQLNATIEDLKRLQQETASVSGSYAHALVHIEVQQTEGLQVLQERCDVLTLQVARLTDTISKTESEAASVMEGKNAEILELQQRLNQHEKEHGATVTAFEATIAEMNQAVAQHDEQWEVFLRSQTASFEAEKVVIQENVNRLTEVVEVLKQQQQECEKPREDETRSAVDGEIQQAEVARVLGEKCNSLASQVALLSETTAKFQTENAQLRENYNQETERHHQFVSQLEESHRTAVAAFEATIAEMSQAVAQHDEQWKEYLRSETAIFDHEKRTLQEQIVHLNGVIEGLRSQQEVDQLQDDQNKEEIARVEGEKSRLTVENTGMTRQLNEVRSQLEQVSFQQKEQERLGTESVEKHKVDVEAWSAEVERLRQLLTQQEERHQASVATFEASITEMNQAVAQHDEEWKEYLRSQTEVLEQEKSVLQEEVRRLNSQIEDLQRRLEETPAQMTTVERSNNQGGAEGSEAQQGKLEPAGYVEPIVEQRIMLEEELQNLYNEHAVAEPEDEWQQRLEDERKQWQDQLASVTSQAEDRLKETQNSLENAVNESTWMKVQMEELQSQLHSREEELQRVKELLKHTVALDKFDEVPQEKKSLSVACSALQEQVASVKHEVETLRSQQESAGSAAMAQPEVINEGVQSQLISLEDEVDSLRSMKKGLEEKVLALEEEVTRLNNQSSLTLQQTVTGYEQRVAAFNQEWQTYVSQQATTFEEEKLALMSQVASLSEELKQTQSLLERMVVDGTFLATNMLVEAADDGKAHCLMCDSLIQKVNEHQEAIDALHGQIQQYEQNSRQLDLGPNGNGRGEPEVSGVFSSMVQQQQVDFGAGDTSEYLDGFPLGSPFEQAELLDTSGMSESEVVRDLKEDRLRLQVELLAVQEECERLQEQLASVRRSPRHSPRRSSMSSLRTLADLAGQVLDDFEIPDDKEDNDEDFLATVHLQDLIVSLQAHVKDLMMELDDATTHNSCLTEELTKTQQALKASEERLVSYGMDFEKERGAKEVLQHEVSRLKDEVSTLTAHLVDKEIHVAALKQQLEEQYGLVQQLRTSTEVDSSNLLQKLRDAYEEKRQTSMKLHETREVIQALQRELEDAQGLGTQAEATLQFTRANLEEKVQEVKTLQEQLRKSQEEMEQTTGALAASEAEKTQLSKTVHRLRTKVSELSNDIKELKEEVERRQSAHDSFRERVSHEAETLDQEIQSLREHLQASKSGLELGVFVAVPFRRIQYPFFCVFQTRDTEYDDLDRETREMRDEVRALKTELKVTKKQLRDTTRQLRQSEQELLSEGGRKSSHASSLNGDSTLSQSSQKAKLKLLDILQSSSDNIPRASNTLKLCMDSLKSEIDDLKSQMDHHIQVVKSKSDLL
ncbi:hypothetical protein RvY_08695-2 [Ramazzottius varieornatus]|uniref:Uncharacterized protein n=1 Tax=Ramazzottius varieornatus TaxID=947166 RepID=A0A1D1VCB9_RAMVA|nr:hypothetical protein RvY_08695-2 [Ramazzottius varieornatus]